MKLDYIWICKLQEILGILIDECGATDAVVAGGAIRDSLLEKPIKDIDIFYIGDLKKEKVKEYFKFETIMEDEDNPYEDSDFQVTYGKLSFPEVEYPIQLIKVNDIAEHLDTFGCGISMVAVFRQGLTLSNNFIQDAGLKMLTFKDDCNDTYRNKIMAKYLDYD